MLTELNSLPRRSEFVFESPRNPGKPIAAFNKLANRWRGSKSSAKTWKIHDVRRTLASGMGRIGIPPHVIEAVIGHRSGIVSGVAAVYNHYKYEAEKRDALERWQTHLAEVVEQFKDAPEETDDDVVL